MPDHARNAVEQVCGIKKESGMIYTSRSKVESYLHCPRRRWWEYEANDGKGLERKVLDPALLVGGCVHLGIETLFVNLRVGYTGPTRAVEAALEKFDSECEERGLNGDAPECRALIEASIRAFHKVRLPLWLEEFDILDVEREEVTLLSDDVTQLARTDVVVRRKSDGSLFVVNWKTTSDAGEKWLKGWETDMQIATEMLAVEQRMRAEAGERGVDPNEISISGVIIEGIVKGSYKNLYDENDQIIGKQLQNPLIYGYKSPANPPLETSTYAAEYKWKCDAPHIAQGRVKTWKCAGGKTHKRDGWERIKVWEEPFVGANGEQIPPDERIAYWISNVVDEATLKGQFASIPPLSRSPEDMRSKSTQIVGVERDIAEKKERVGGGDSLDANFCKNERGCNWPVTCPMYQICWEAETAADPIGSGLYVERVENHPIPKET